MPDPYDPPEDDPAARAGDAEDSGRLEDARDGPFPWDEEVPDDPDGERQRHDAFTEAKKSLFLRALVKTGCIKDTCRLTGISRRTVYRHQEGDPGFFENCRIALRISGTPVEITAWQRAVEGVEQEFACGGQVHVRRRYSDGLLRLLLQGSNPKKYGPHPGFKRKRLLKHERKQMEREIRAELAARQKPWSFDEAMKELDRKLEFFGLRDDKEKLATGWTKTADAHWIPPGYAWVGLPEGSDGPCPGTVPLSADCPLPAPGGGSGDAASGGDTPRDSM